ncbi:multicopper oxidase family protein [Paraburkholderia sp. BCC1884]|uniref:multicopper oxidase family protein n=1 Tax=Paraburkholderia sp. BCC1884 TaxID=2562668 RepID=UPI0011828CF2|nr:multicopper oxidase family protein [Paraburkholderia sp. BCC1884]
MPLSRREFITTSFAIAMAGLTRDISSNAGTLVPNLATNGSDTKYRLLVDRRDIEVNGRSANAYSLAQADGTRGVFLNPGESFSVALINGLNEPTIVHWHGQTPPSNQDGVDQFGIAALGSGEQRIYNFPARPGTHWMHSHVGFQAQDLLAAPLIVRTNDEVRSDTQEVTVFLEDFLFRDPNAVMASLQELNQSGQSDNASQSAMPGMSEMKPMDMSSQSPNGRMDFNDVNFDAYLANNRTLSDPDIIRVEHGGRVRLRVINGAASTNFHVDLGSLRGTVVAVDGDAVKPLLGSRFGLAMAQRIDIIVELPKGSGVWPIVAVREGERDQTGVILASTGAKVNKLPNKASRSAGPVAFQQEMQLSALTPLADRPVDASHTLMLKGSMHPYSWSINGKQWPERDTVKVRAGQRVAITFHNMTMMSHPMHLHGHHFQVIAFNGKAFPGAMRDTILVPPMTKVTIAFDADNPGQWLLHCHNDYHMAAGMMTDVAYI